MRSLPLATVRDLRPLPLPSKRKAFTSGQRTLPILFPRAVRLENGIFCSPSTPTRLSHREAGSVADDDEFVIDDLRVPDRWLLATKALEESEWLRAAVHKWLDDEYCPEPSNVEISKIAAKSYYESLLRKQTDLGAILLKIATDLESISYQESFHGAFSAANAAINLIAERIESAL